MAFRKAFNSSTSSLKTLVNNNRSLCIRLKSTSSNEIESINKIPLSESVPWLPKPTYVSSSNFKADTKVTTLPNGLRVATESGFGRFFTAGVLIDSGSRHEVAFTSGISHFLEKLAFHGTENYENKEAILKELELHGGICDCQSSRDTMIYAVSAETKGMDSVIRLLSDVVLRPKLIEDDLMLAKQTISFELEDLELRPEKELILTEMIHSAAYKDNTLGLPKICPTESIPIINQNVLFTYLKNYYVPSRMVLAAVGVEHEKLVDCALKKVFRVIDVRIEHLDCQIWINIVSAEDRERELDKKNAELVVFRCFVDDKPIWEKNSDLIVSQSVRADESISQYTGGVIKEEKDLSNVSLGPTPMPELVHMVVGLESCGHQHEDFIPFCVLNMMMGGGGSFSAGGPGKGMYTRLYTNVLNRFHWMYNATAYNHAYHDSGVFCIHASSHPSQLNEMASIIVKEFVNMAGRVSQTELDRAKKQLQSMLLMNLESRPVMFEDMGRQVLSTGHRKQPSYFIEKIQKINENDIRRVASNMLKSKPAVAALGNLDKLPGYDDICSGLMSKEGKMPKRFSLFR